MEKSQNKLGARETDEQNARPIKKVNPYDCFRSGETRESIIKCVQEVELEMEAAATKI